MPRVKLGKPQPRKQRGWQPPPGTIPSSGSAALPLAGSPLAAPPLNASPSASASDHGTPALPQDEPIVIDDDDDDDNIGGDYADDSDAGFDGGHEDTPMPDEDATTAAQAIDPTNINIGDFYFSSDEEEQEQVVEDEDALEDDLADAVEDADPNPEPLDDDEMDRYEDLMDAVFQQSDPFERGRTQFDLNLNEEDDDIMYDAVSVGSFNFRIDADWGDEYRPEVATIQTAYPRPEQPFTTRPVKLIKFLQKEVSDLSEFHFAFALLAHVSGLSRPDYKTWIEMLATVRDQDGRPIPDLLNLPRQLSTLKSRVTRQLPLSDMRLTQIPVNPEKMPSEKAARKRELAEAVVRAKAQTEGDIADQIAAAEADLAGATEILTNLWFFDPVSLFQGFLCSDTAKTMHTGMAHIVDQETELMHARCWTSSIRASSGDYPHFRLDDGSNGDAIFPSDFIYYWCTGGEFGNCNMQCQDITDFRLAHIGRVVGYGRDYTRTGVSDEEHGVVLQVMECFDGEQLMLDNPGCTLFGDDGFEKQELFLNIDEVEYVREANVGGWAPVIVDHYTGETFVDPSPPLKKRKFKYPKYRMRPPIPVSNNYFVRRWINFDDEEGELCEIGPMAHRHPVRAELELKEYGREYFVKQWDQDNAPLPVLSCPLVTFIDGFGLYSNSFRSLMGFYMSPAGLCLEDRLRPLNIFPLLVGPHGTNFNDVVKSLECLLPLDKGVVMTINDQETLVCVYTMLYVGDMPQQDKGAGTKGPRGLKFSRFCHIGETHQVEKMDVLRGFDCKANGRYHYQHVQMRNEMDYHLVRATHRQAYGTQWGISEERPSLTDISPAADRILTFPIEPSHSEFKGFTCFVHELLIDGLLTAPGRREYARVLRNWPFPTYWPALMSPIHHLLNYSLSDHGRWSVVVSPLLRTWLQKDHIDPFVWPYLVKVFLKEGDEEHMSEEEVAEEVIRLIIRMLFVGLVSGNAVLMGRRPLKDTDDLNEIAVEPRVWYSKVCQAVALGIMDNPKANKGPGDTRKKAREARAKKAAAKAKPTDKNKKPSAREQLRVQAMVRFHKENSNLPYGHEPDIPKPKSKPKPKPKPKAKGKGTKGGAKGRGDNDDDDDDNGEKDGDGDTSMTDASSPKRGSTPSTPSQARSLTRSSRSQSLTPSQQPSQSPSQSPSHIDLSEDVVIGLDDAPEDPENNDMTEAARQRADEEQLYKEAITKNMPRRALDFYYAPLRPNIHVSMHWNDMFEEYGLAAHANCLPFENKHGDFKKNVRRTNFNNVEKLLLMMENVQQSIRFVLLNSFKTSHEELTDKLQSIYKSCPTLFEKVLPLKDRQSLEHTLRDEDGEEEEVLDVDDAADGDHIKPRVIGKELNRDIKDKEHAVVYYVRPGQEVPAGWAGPIGRKLPLRHSALTEPFRRQLSAAYARDYNMPDLTLITGRSKLQYCKKLRFEAKNGNVFVFRTGEFFEYRVSAGSHRLGRLDYIFLHDFGGKRRIFCIVTRHHLETIRDNFIGQPIVSELERPIILGLRAIIQKRPYVVKSERVGCDPVLLYIDWKPMFL